jgi:hypothetical protein
LTVLFSIDWLFRLEDKEEEELLLKLTKVIAVKPVVCWANAD